MYTVTHCRQNVVVDALSTDIAGMTAFTNRGLEARVAALDHAQAQVEALPASVRGREESLFTIAAARRFLEMGSVRQAHGALREVVNLLTREGEDTTALDRLIEAAHRAV